MVRQPVAAVASGLVGVLLVGVLLVGVLLVGCSNGTPSSPGTVPQTSAAVIALPVTTPFVEADVPNPPSVTSSVTTSASAITASGRLVAAARKQIGVTVGYDPSYARLAYPGGDVSSATGVCTDVLVRALREQGIDLQERIHVDMAANFQEYPKFGASRCPTPTSTIGEFRTLPPTFRAVGMRLR